MTRNETNSWGVFPARGLDSVDVSGSDLVAPQSLNGHTSLTERLTGPSVRAPPLM
jgi:hypothetical protein